MNLKGKVNVTSGLNRCAIFVVGTLGLNLRSQVVCLDRDINPDVQMLTANAWKRTGSFAREMSAENIGYGCKANIHRGRTLTATLGPLADCRLSLFSGDLAAIFARKIASSTWRQTIRIVIFIVEVMAMAKQGQHVVRSSSGGWAVKKAGSSRASSVHDTQAEAIKAATRIAQNQKTELYIHGRDGRIRERSSYGNDPHPPKG